MRIPDVLERGASQLSSVLTEDLCSPRLWGPSALSGPQGPQGWDSLVDQGPRVKARGPLHLQSSRATGRWSLPGLRRLTWGRWEVWEQREEGSGGLGLQGDPGAASTEAQRVAGALG